MLNSDLVLFVDAVALCFIANEDVEAPGVVVHPIVFEAGCTLNQGGAIAANDNFGGGNFRSIARSGFA